MKIFSTKSIKNKIVILVVAISAVSLLLAFSIVTIYEIFSFKSSLVREASMIARMTGDYCSSALIFSDRDEALKVMQKLESIPYIEWAVLYNEIDEVFATYGNAPVLQVEARADNSEKFLKDSLLLYRRIIFQNEKVGAIRLSFSVKPLYDKIETYIVYSLLLMVILIAMTFIITLRFQRIISKPIMELSETAKMIGEKADYSIRVKNYSDEEIGILSGGFNNMLGQIQKRQQERDMSEEALKKSELRFRKIIEESTDPMFVLREGRLLFVNTRFQEYSGYSSDELTSHDFDLMKLVVDEDRKVFQKFINRMPARDIVNRFDFRGTSKNGGVFDFDLNVTTLEWEGSFVFLGTMRDITDRKKTQESLSRERERLAVTLRSIADGVISVDTSGRITLLNRAAEKILDVIPEESIGKSIDDVFSLADEKTGEPLHGRIKDILESSRYLIEVKTAIRRTKFGQERIISYSAAPLQSSISRVIGSVIVFRDITEEREMEAEIQKIQKLESVGILAGGIAHDFNNILTAVLGNISLARVEVEKESDVYSVLGNAEQSVIRAQGLTQQLLTFSKGGAPVKKLFPIRDVIRDTVLFCLMGSNVKSIFNFPEDLWLCEYDSGQICQVFNNLTINSKQAMPEGGVLMVSSENYEVTSDSNTAYLHSTGGTFLSPGKYVKITVNDNGVGIDKKHIRNIFDPYFSTKNQGSGLGLSVVFSIIKQHRGYIDVESEPGIGTTFFIFLPAIERPAALKKESESNVKKDKARPAGGRILLMDDEENIRKVAKRMLNKIGYEVVETQNGEEAIEEYKNAKESGTPFDAVIMDLTIPGGMGGKECIEHLVKYDPGIKAIVSSGYSNDPVMADHRSYGFTDVIVKPYRIEQMTETLNAVLS